MFAPHELIAAIWTRKRRLSNVSICMVDQVMFTIKDLVTNRTFQIHEASADIMDKWSMFRRTVVGRYQFPRQVNGFETGTLY